MGEAPLKRHLFTVFVLRRYLAEQAVNASGDNDKEFDENQILHTLEFEASTGMTEADN